VLRLKCPFGIRRRVAYHEMGHALVAAGLPGVDPVHKVSIIPRGGGAREQRASIDT
jgi:ATP-dependent Zn protease